MILEFSGLSHKGKVRKSNEDYIYIPGKNQEQNIAMVADGMGGHSAGETASKMAVETILQSFLNLENNKNEISPSEEIKAAIELSNTLLYGFSLTDKSYEGMGTTLVLSYFLDNKVYIGNVGDSRCYLFREDEIVQITRDHSLVQELLDKGTITDEEYNNHPRKNVITRALGTEETILVDCHQLDLQNDDILILCTDGLTHHVDLKEKVDVFKSTNNVSDLSKYLVNLALERGGTDNVSLVLIKYMDTSGER